MGPEKILIVLGSPRKNGNTATLAEALAKGAVNALRTFQDMWRAVGAEIVGMVYGSASKAGEIKQNRDAMEKAYRLGRQLASHGQ